MNDRPKTRHHRGILINKIGPTGLPGGIFAIGVATMIVVAFPQLGWFLLAAVVLGALAAYLLHSRPQRSYSIFGTERKRDVQHLP